MYINKEMSLEHVATTVKQIREYIGHRYQKKVPEGADIEPPSLDGRGSSVGRVEPRSSELVNFVIQGPRKRPGRALDWLISDAV